MVSVTIFPIRMKPGHTGNMKVKRARYTLPRFLDVKGTTRKECEP